MCGSLLHNLDYPQQASLSEDACVGYCSGQRLSRGFSCSACVCLNNVLQETLLSAMSRTQASAVISGQPLLSSLSNGMGILQH